MMGNNKGIADQGRFSKDHPKTSGAPKCRACKGRIDKNADDWHVIGGSRWHKRCRP